MYFLNSTRGRTRFPGTLMLCAWGLVAPALAQPIAYDEALRLAEEHAPALKAHEQQLEAARQDAQRAGRLPDPRMTLAVSNWPVTGRDAFAFNADEMTMKQVGVMQHFPARAKRRAQQAVAQRAIEQAEAVTAADRLAVRKLTARAWIALQAAENEVTLLQSLRESPQIAVGNAKARLSASTGSATDALAAQAAALNLELQIDMAQVELDAARAGLARWLDRMPSDIQTAGQMPDLDRLPVNEGTLLASVDALGPLLPWRSREALASASVSEADAGRHPDWSLGLTYGQRGRSPAGGHLSDMVMLEFSVDLPLFTANRQDRDVAARRADQRAAVADLEEAQRAQAEALRRTLAEWQGLKRQIARKEHEILPLAHDRSQAALAAYKAGGELQPWIEARRDEVQLHVEHARHLRDLGRAWAELAFLMPATGETP